MKIILRLFILLLILFLSQQDGKSQTYNPKRLKALKSAFDKSVKDTMQVKLLYETGDYYLLNLEASNSNGYLDTAFNIFQKALNLSTQLHKDDGYGRLSILCKLGDIYYKKNDTLNGKASYMKVVGHYKANHDLLNVANTYRKWSYTLGQTGRLQERMYYLNAILSIYEKLNFEEGVVKTQVRIIGAHMQLGKTEMAKDMFLKFIEKYKHTNYQDVDFAFQALATHYRYRGDFNKALYYSLESIKWMNKTRDTAKAELLYGQLALIYQELGQVDKSIEFYKKTLALREKLLVPQESVYRTAGFLVQQLIKKHQPTEGLNYVMALERRYPPVDNDNKANLALVKAYCYNALKKFDLAEQSYKEMLRLYSNHSSEAYSIALYDISKFYVEQKKYKKAAHYLAFVFSESLYTPRTKETQLLLYKIDSASGNYLSAIKHYLKFKALSDSLFNIAKNKQLEELQVQYETAQKTKDIKLLKKERQIQFDKANQATNVRNFTLVGIVLLLGLLGMINQSYRINKRNNRALNLLIKDKDGLLDEKDGLLNEKEWLIKEVHHRVKNNLQIVMGLLQRQSAYINNTEALTAIQNSENRMHSIALIHQKLYQSENLDLINMREYIDELISYLKDSSDLGNRIHFDKEVDDIYLEVSQAVPLGLILNEAITNAIKYAYSETETGTIKVHLCQTGDDLNLLTIGDDGPGLPADFNIDVIGSLGMNLMKGLSKQLGGTFEINNDKGLNINITFKIEKFIGVTTEPRS